MAINFTDSPADGATQVISGRTYTYNSAKNKWDTTATEVVGPTAKTYATVNDLPGTALTGDQAFVSGTNRLYIWNGSGWYNIALVNSTPTWTTQPDSSYILASDGTATTITIVATDPEGLPITYSIASDTSGNIATVAQGTGLQTNTFTITPSTSDADAGTFSLTFRASDGVNVASAISSFTLQFKVVNSNYTTALITSVGTNNQVNNSFVDSSTNSHTITAVGNTTQTTFSPYRHGGYSTYFDGSGDYIQPAGTTIFDIPSSTASFTVEAWINPPALPSAGAYNYRFGSIISKGVVYVSFGFTSNGTLRFYTYSGVENYINSAAGVIEAGKWQHVALVSNAGSITLYKDGVSVATGTLVAPQAAGNGVAPKIATADTGQASDFINSYVSDLRVVDGTAVYTSNFTPPTERLTAITNTSLLTCHLPYIADGSTNGHSITVYGNTSTQPFAPYEYEIYSAADNVGSASFDGSGDKLTIPGTYANFGTNPFTVEAWVYPTTANGPIFAAHRVGTASGFYFTMSTTNNTIGHGRYQGSNASTYSSANAVKLNQWNHFAWCREGTGSNQIRMFANGKVVATYTDNQDYSSAPYGPYVGGYDAGGNQVDVNGNIADLRIVSGTALYTTDFTPPTAPLTAITNTTLLLKGTNAGIIDKSQSVKSITLNGDVKSSTTQSKYLTSSMYFDGTADYITLSDSDLREFGGNNFTMEFWIKTTISTQYATIISRTPSGFAAGMWTILMNNTVSGGEVAMYIGDVTGDLVFVTSGASIRDDSWHHVAVVRNGSTFTCYIDGTSRGSGTWAGSITNINGDIRIGMDQNYIRYFEGYLSDFRITKGLARYTANFTPPTAALQG